MAIDTEEAVDVAAERSRSPETLAVHEGHEWLYVLGGVDGPVRFLLLVGPQGERMHLRA